MNIDQLEKLLPQVIIAAFVAGKEILEVYNETASLEIEYKSDNSPLTIADKRAHDVIKAKLENTNIPFLSEESGKILYEDRKNWTEFWLVDPLDGTKEFIKRNGEFTVNIALIENGRPVLGVVFAPVLKKIYYGYGNHAFLCKDIDFSTNLDEIHSRIQQKSISLPLQIEKGQFVVVASRSHLSKETEEYIEQLKEKHGSVDIKSIGSSLKLCLIAEGLVDIYPRFGPTMEWDTAAGHAVVNASGGNVLEAESKQPLKYNKENQLNPWFIVNKKE